MAIGALCMYRESFAELVLCIGKGLSLKICSPCGNEEEYGADISQRGSAGESCHPYG